MISTTLFPQVCEITAANDSIGGEKRGKMEKNFLNPQIFPQTASERLDLFSCLASSYPAMLFEDAVSM